jgi:hypothetical protein
MENKVYHEEIRKLTCELIKLKTPLSYFDTVLASMGGVGMYFLIVHCCKFIADHI